MEKIKIPIQKYWNWRSSSYGYDIDKSPDIADQWESVLKDLLAEAPGKSALDVGTGMGQFAFYLARSGFDVTGIDLSEKMISHARQYALRHRLEIDFQTGDAEALDFEDNSFDVVVSRNLLWTLPHPRKALQEWMRVMKPGGRLVVSDGFWHNNTWKQAPKIAFNAARDMFKNGSMVSFRFFCSYAGLQKHLPYYEGITPEDTEIMLHRTGFTNVRSYDISRLPFHPYNVTDKKGIKKENPSFFITYADR